MIRSLLPTEPKEKARFKAREISKLSLSDFEDGDLRVKVHSLSHLGNGGIEVMVQAWEGKKQLGFGSDFDTDKERFKIWNPPIMVDDPNGEIVLRSEDEKGNVSFRYLREDPIQALKETLSRVIRQTGKVSKIKKGSIGNTTSVFYPAVDGRTQNNDAGSWATVIASAGDAFADSDTNRNIVGFGCTSTLNQYDTILHGWFKFDTSALPDTDVVSAATLAIYVATKDSTLGGSISFVNGTVASTTNLAATDHLNYNTTKFATDWTYAGLTTGAYNNAALNASGIAAISLTGYTTIALVTEAELTGVQPSWGSLQSSVMEARLVEFAGTSSDPTLTVTHAAAASTPKMLASLGVG